jgi:hypothetical protein
LGYSRESPVGDRIPDLNEEISGDRAHLGLNDGIERVAELTPKLDEGIPG